MTSVNEEDCPICMEEMSPSDFQHPLQCSNHCGYNFCKRCIESFILSSKDDYKEASDGSYHVKVFLRCPNCRSDLKLSIRNTLLLRKTDAITLVTDECELSLSELRTKAALEYPQVQETIREAQRIEATYLGREPPLEHVEYEEVGFEVDLNESVEHQDSFSNLSGLSTRDVVLDPTLLAGLDCLLNYDEGLYVMDLMTSGDPSRVADAAQILFSVGYMNKYPQQPREPEMIMSPMASRVCLAKQSSILRLIVESQEEFNKHTARGTGRGVYNRPVNKVQRSQQPVGKAPLESLIPSARLRKLFPLPNRMPKCVEINLVDKFDFKFVNSDWDDAVVDNAYYNSPTGSGCVPFVEGVSSILTWSVDEEDEVDEIESLPLVGESLVVLLHHPGKEAGSQGARRGDVVTHIAEESIAGMTAGGLLTLLKAKKEEGSRTVLVTLNAEKSIAETLKRRSIDIAKSCPDFTRRVFTE